MNRRLRDYFVSLVVAKISRPKAQSLAFSRGLIGFDLGGLAVVIGDGEGISAVGVVHGFPGRIVLLFRTSHADGEISLKFVHAGLDFVYLYRRPHLGRPV